MKVITGTTIVARTLTARIIYKLAIATVYFISLRELNLVTNQYTFGYVSNLSVNMRNEEKSSVCKYSVLLTLQ